MFSNSQDEKTTLHERYQIVALSEQGLSQRFVAGHMHLPHSTVGSILARFWKDGEVLDCPRLDVTTSVRHPRSETCCEIIEQAEIR